MGIAAASLNTNLLAAQTSGYPATALNPSFNPGNALGSFIDPGLSNNPSSNNPQKINSLSQGLYKLLGDTIASGLIAAIGFYAGMGHLINSSFYPEGKLINDRLHKILIREGNPKAQLPELLEKLVTPGDSEPYHQYWALIDKHKTDLIKEGITEKQFKRHQVINRHYRRVLSAILMMAVNWLRAVVFAPNANWNNLQPFSASAILALTVPVATSIAYWQVYDRFKPQGLINFGFAQLPFKVARDRTDLALDGLKAVAKSAKRFVWTGNIANDTVTGLTVLSASLLSRGVRNNIEEGCAKKQNLWKWAPTTGGQIAKTSAAKAILKAAIDAPLFALIVSGALGVWNFAMRQLNIGTPVQATAGISVFNSANFPPGLTTKQMAFA
jgi:hypothetical protein